MFYWGGPLLWDGVFAAARQARDKQQKADFLRFGALQLLRPSLAEITARLTLLRTARPGDRHHNNRCERPWLRTTQLSCLCTSSLHQGMLCRSAAYPTLPTLPILPTSTDAGGHGCAQVLHARERPVHSCAGPAPPARLAQTCARRPRR